MRIVIVTEMPDDIGRAFLDDLAAHRERDETDGHRDGGVLMLDSADVTHVRVVPDDEWPGQWGSALAVRGAAGRMTATECDLRIRAAGR